MSYLLLDQKKIDNWMMSNLQNLTQEIRRIEVKFLNVKREVKTLKNRVRAYKGWTTKYRRKQKQLRQDNLVITQERDRAIKDLQELQSKQESLLKEMQQAKQAQDLRDNAKAKLDDVINKIEQYREICIKANKITYADKVYLIQEAEKLFFDDEVITIDIELDRDSQPQMFEDQASIGRYLLDS